MTWSIIFDSQEIFFCFCILFDFVSDFIDVRKVILLSCNSETDLDILFFKLFIFEDLNNFVIVFFALFELYICLVLLCMDFWDLIFFLENIRYTFYHLKVLLGTFLLNFFELESSRNLMVTIHGLWKVFETLSLAFDFR
jgi:hypothetical protein